MARKAVWGILIALAAVAAAAQEKEAPIEFTGRCVGVTDGDRVSVISPGKKMVTVRLYGIDCPEKKQPFGTEAKKFTSSAVFGKVVTVKVTDTDRQGQKNGTVILSDGTNLNHELVKEGLAWWYREYAPKDKDLEKFETEANAAKKGLWADNDSVAPWEWRKKDQAERAASAKVRAKERRAREQELKSQAGTRRAKRKEVKKAPEKTTTNSSGETVYVTDSDKKYHRAGCRYLKKSKIKTTLAEAKQKQYQPCTVCKPPK